MIRRVTDYDGNVLEENLPELRDVISARTARTMVDLMQEPVRRGTATRVQELKRPAAGKTGTTNDFTDAWFIGYTPSLAAGVWIGFDEKVTLGDRETGGRAALPPWLELMQHYYKDKPVEQFEQADLPPRVITAAPEAVVPTPAPINTAEPLAAQPVRNPE
jgi:penicillin-binding protein 1A